MSVVSDNFKRRKDIKSSRDIVFRWSRITIDATNKQIIYLANLSKSISESTELMPKGFMFSRNMADKLQDVSAERMTSLFVTNSKPRSRETDMQEKCAFNIVSAYDFLTAIQNDIRDKYEFYNKACHDVRNRWNAVTKKIQRDREKLDSPLQDCHSSSNNTNVSKTLINIFDSYLYRRDTTQDCFTEQYEEFIRPLNAAVDICKTNYPDATCGKAVYEDAREMQRIYEQWKANIDGYSEIFATVTNTLKESVDSLSKAIDYFENKTIVKFWCR